MQAMGGSGQDAFQSTAPVWGPTDHNEVRKGGHHISIHGPRVGADRSFTRWSISSARFQSTAPVWGPTADGTQYNSATVFQSTAPVWGPTVLKALADMAGVFQSTAPVWGPTRTVENWCTGANISIHGPRVGADTANEIQRLLSNISIHGPRVGADKNNVFSS